MTMIITHEQLLTSAFKLYDPDESDSTLGDDVYFAPAILLRL